VNKNIWTILLVALFFVVSHYHLEIISPVFLAWFFYLFFSDVWEKICKKSNVWSASMRSIILVGVFLIILILAWVLAWNFIWENFTLLLTELEWWFTLVRDSISKRLQSASIGWIFADNKESLISFSNIKEVIWWTYNSLEFLWLTTVLTIILLWFEKRLVYSLKMIAPEMSTYISYSKSVVWNYVRWISLMTVIISIIYFIWLLIFWVQYAALIAIFAGLAALIPTVGTLFWWILTVSATWILTWEVNATVWISIWIVCAQILEEYVILPKFVWDKVALNPFITLLWIIIFWYIRWVLWIFLSTPILWTILEFWKKNKTWYYYLLWKEKMPQ